MKLYFSETPALSYLENLLHTVQMPGSTFLLYVEVIASGLRRTAGDLSK